jgi:uncharacterized membrane protein YtjA (UPF0391 family)
MSRARFPLRVAASDVGYPAQRLKNLPHGTPDSANAERIDAAQFLLDRWMRQPAQQRCSSKEGIVLYYALVFLVVALIAGVLGVSGVAAVATNIAYVLFVVALVLFVVHLIMGRRTIVP